MTYQLEFHQKPSYLHIIVTGENSRENTLAYLRQVVEECAERRCYRVLIEERLVGPRLGTLDVFEVTTEASGRALGVLRAVAYVDVNAEGDLMRFAETIAHNRAVPVRVFTTVMEAEEWLEGLEE